jgi:hypothetical protein
VLTEILTDGLLYFNRGGAVVVEIHWLATRTFVTMAPVHVLTHFAFRRRRPAAPSVPTGERAVEAALRSGSGRAVEPIGIMAYLLRIGRNGIFAEAQRGTALDLHRPTIDEELNPIHEARV